MKTTAKRFNTFLVMLNGMVIDTVYFLTGICADEVRRSLIDHDGYSINITVRRGK